MKDNIKTVLISLSIFLIGLIVIELIFGTWFRQKNQLELEAQTRMGRTYYYPVKNLYKSDNKTIKVSLDDYGLRGKLSFNHPEKINILTVGGSTTAEGSITDGKTWQDVLQNEFIKDNKNIIIGNAGVAGRTTIGHIRDFEVWFPRIPGLSPQYIFFYIGINDVVIIEYDRNTDLHNYNGEYFKMNSAIWNLLRTIRGAILARKNNISYGLVDHSQVKYTEKGVMTEKEFDEYKRKADTDFRNRLLKLIEMTEAMEATPVFITQPVRAFKYTEDHTIVGVEGKEFGGIDYYKKLNELNRIIYEVAGDKYIVVELTELPIWEDSDFFDYIHTTPSGSQKVAVEIYKQIKEKIFVD